MIAPSAYVLGGLATWLDYIDPGLAGRGWDVTVGLVEGPQFHDPAQYVVEHPHRRWLAIPCSTLTPEGRCRAIMRTIRKVRPEIVASVNIPDVYPAIARLRRQREGSPKVIMTVHGIEAFLYDDIYSNRSVLDAVVCTNKLACKLARNLGGMAGDRILYAPYGTQGAKFLTCNSQEVRELHIAYVGRLEQWQKRVLDIPTILDRLEQFDVPFVLHVAGDGPEMGSLKQKLLRYVDKVRFYGRLGPKDLENLIYNRANVLLLTSFWETGPLVIWEAMASGLAVVSSNYIGSGAEAALRHGENALLFPVADGNRAAEELARIWHEPELRQLLCRNAQELVTKRYCVEKSIKAWDNVLRKVLNLSPLSTALFNSTKSASGRLDHCFGTSFAETIREITGRKGRASEPGGEWPHSYSRKPVDDNMFWLRAKEEDLP